MKKKENGFPSISLQSNSKISLRFASFFSPIFFFLNCEKFLRNARNTANFPSFVITHKKKSLKMGKSRFLTRAFISHFTFGPPTPFLSSSRAISNEILEHRIKNFHMSLFHVKNSLISKQTRKRKFRVEKKEGNNQEMQCKCVCAELGVKIFYNTRIPSKFNLEIDGLRFVMTWIMLEQISDTILVLINRIFTLFQP